VVAASKHISILLFTIIAIRGLGIQESSQEGLVVGRRLKTGKLLKQR
jgi:hypothetical protein